MSKQSKYLFSLSIFGPYKYFAMILFAVIMLTAVAETLSLGMILPLLKAILTPGENDSDLQLTVESIDDWKEFCVELLNAKSQELPNPGKQIYIRLTEESQKAVEDISNQKPLNEEDQERIINELNLLLKQSDFYQEDSFRNLKLSSETRHYIDKDFSNLSQEQIELFNRYLFRDIFPDLIMYERGHSILLSYLSYYFQKEYHLVIVCVIAFLLIFIKNLLILTRTYLSKIFLTNLRGYWSCNVLQNYIFSSYRILSRQQHGVLLNNVITEPIFASKGLTDAIDFLGRFAFVVCITIALFIENWFITLISFAAGFIVVLLQWGISQRYSYGIGQEKIFLNQQVSGLCAESLSGIRQVKSFSLENRVLSLFKKKIDRLMRLIVRIGVAAELPRVIVELLIISILLGSLLYYIYAQIGPIDTIIPTIAFFVIASQRLFLNLSEMLSKRITLISYLPSIHLANDLVNQNIERESLDSGIGFNKIEKNISFQNVGFSFDEQSTLFTNLNLEIPRHGITAIAGPSGSGKSTICDLLIGLQKSNEGSIRIDNKSMNDLNIREWRKRIGYVSQDTFLFNLSVSENIQCANPSASMEDIVHAVQQAGAHEFVMRLPDQYDTLVGESGVSLSVGQRQRLAIARAIVRNPELLIVDEATSALDSESERQVLALLDSLRDCTTILMVTHHLKTLYIADWIYVLDNGQIVEAGSFKDLKKNEGLFWKLESMLDKHSCEHEKVSDRKEPSGIVDETDG